MGSWIFAIFALPALTISILAVTAKLSLRGIMAAIAGASTGAFLDRFATYADTF
jgi:hypothetical protein